jgi:hypothetical protein
MSMKMMWTGAVLGLVLASAASAQISSVLNACPPGTQYAEAQAPAKGKAKRMAATEGAGTAGQKLASTEGAGAANPNLASTEGAGTANPKLASTEGAGAANPNLASTEGAGTANPKLASAQGSATRLSNGVARMPDGTYCSPVQ